MRLRYSLLLLFISVLTFTSCKENSDKNISDSDLQLDVEEIVNEEPINNTTSTEETQKRSNSVMARVMSNGECKTFASFLISAELSERLLNDEGPITIFAPSEEAINAMDEETVQDLLNAESKQIFTSAVQTHVVEGSYDSVTIIQALKQGKVALTTLNGEKLKVSQNGNDIYVEDSKGNKAKVGKSDINGSNGIVHIIDSFLGLD